MLDKLIDLFKLAPQGFSPSRIPTWVWRVVEVVLVVIVFVALIPVSLAYDLGNVLKAPRVLEPVFLSLLALLVYAAVRLFFFLLWNYFLARSRIPDIDAAVEELLIALRRQNLSLGDLPVHLVLGLPPGQEAAFATSSMVGARIQVSDRDLPLHFYGDERALWVVLSDVGALCRQAQSGPRSAAEPARAAGGAPAFSTQAFEDQPAPLAGGGAGDFRTIGGDGPAAEAAVAVAAEPKARPQQAILIDERDEGVQRLEYFLDLWRRIRYPICPVNGVIVFLPYAWMNSGENSMLGAMAGADVRALEDNLGVRCLMLAVIHDIASDPGFDEFIRRWDAKHLQNRVGCGWPALTSFGEGAGEKMHDWLTDYFKGQLYKMYQTKLDPGGNGRLFRLLAQFTDARNDFVRLMNNAFPTASDPLYLGGVYFAAVGATSRGVASPFLDGVLHRMHQSSDEHIGWTDASVASDRRLRGLMGLAVAAVVAMVILDAVLILGKIFVR